jgi:hypothetical protein
VDRDAQGRGVVANGPRRWRAWRDYFYDRQRHEFYLLSLEGPDDTLTVADFLENPSAIQPAENRRKTVVARSSM